MRSAVLAAIVSLGLLSVAVAEDDKAQFSDIELTVTHTTKKLSVVLAIPHSGTATLKVTGKDPVSMQPTAIQIHQLDVLLKEADIANIDSQVKQRAQRRHIVSFKLSVTVNKKTHVISGWLNEYDKFEEQLDPLMNYLLHEDFHPIQPQKSEDF